MQGGSPILFFPPWEELLEPHLLNNPSSASNWSAMITSCTRVGQFPSWPLFLSIHLFITSVPVPPCFNHVFHSKFYTLVVLVPLALDSFLGMSSIYPWPFALPFICEDQLVKHHNESHWDFFVGIAWLLGNLEERVWDLDDLCIYHTLHLFGSTNVLFKIIVFLIKRLIYL